MKKRRIILLLFLMVLFPFQVHAQSIRLVAPENGKTVTMVDSHMKKWWDSKEKIPPKYKKDHSVPKGVTLKWKGSAKEYKVFLIPSQDILHTKLCKTTKNFITFYNLEANQTYYWKVTEIDKNKKTESSVYSFKTGNYPRLIRVNGISNFRDIGGYKTEDGKMVNQGMVYRSSNFDKIGSKGKKDIQSLGIKSDFDIRHYGEGTGGTKSPAGLKYIHIPGVQYNSIKKKINSRKRITREMKVFANRENYPIVIHCAQGKDRTGTLVFLLNGLLGVNKKDLFHDYALSFLSKNKGKHHKQRMQQLEELCEYMENYKDKNKPLSYNIEQFLMDYGMTRAEVMNIKSIMVKENVPKQ